MSPEAYCRLHRLTMEAFGEMIGLHKSGVSRLFRGIQQVSPAKAMDIERITKGAIGKGDLRPDLWPPKVPQGRRTATSRQPVARRATRVKSIHRGGEAA